jgi:Flp pilus assembly protein TadB
MISVVAVLCVLLVRSWMPVTAHARLARITGRGAVLPLDARLSQWNARRRLQSRGQPETTRLLQMLIAELSAGIVTAQAFAHVLGTEFAAPEQLTQSPPTADTHIWRDVAHLWAASDRAGLSMALALQRIHSYALIDQEVAREVQANVAAPRFAVLTLVMMPVLAWMTAGATGARPIEFLTTTPVGWVCVVVGLLLFALALLWMRSLTRSALE